MNKTKTIFLLISILLTVLSCTSIKEGLSSNKNNTDEFLVEKKAPLVMPPEFNELPVPSNNSIEDDNENNAKKLITKSGTSNPDMGNSENTNSNLEESILEKIKK
tara:strand:+ start:206 stop:520 length:315 start_codon:yes stop_codon:yes gene_type:complete